jgi:hypothetical protein
MQYHALPPEQRPAHWARAAAWVRQTNDMTALYADAWRNPWTPDDDRFLLEHPILRHQDAAMELGRTCHAAGGGGRRYGCGIR